MELLAPVLSWILDRTIPDVRTALGNRGCFLSVVIAAGILVYMYLGPGQGEDWTAFFVVGPLALIVIVVMVTVTYGLAPGSRTERVYAAGSESPDSQEPASRSIAEGPPAQDGKALGSGEPSLVPTDVRPHVCAVCNTPSPVDSVYCGECGAALLEGIVRE